MPSASSELASLPFTSATTRRWSLFATVSLVLMFSACDGTLPTTASAPLEPAASVASDDGHQRHVPPLPRFTIAIETSGPLSVGVPFRVQATTTSLVATNEVELRLTLPELEYAEATAWRLDRSSKDIVDGSRSGVRKSMPTEAQLVRDTVVQFRKPGYYRVVASAFKRSDDPNFLDGRRVQDVAHMEIWLFVDSVGGRVVEAYDPAIIPMQYVATPGPFRLKRQVEESRRDGPSAARTGVAAALLSVEEGARRLVYYDYDSSAYTGIPEVGIYWQFYDIQYGGPTGGGSAITNVEGLFPAPCPSWFEYAQGVYTMGNSRITAGHGMHVSDQYFEGGGGDCNDYWEIVLPSNPSRAYHRMTEVADASAAIFGFARPALGVEIRPVAASRYEPYYDKVVLEQPTFVNGQPSLSDGLWGGSGRFTMAHEYGHAAHEKAFGGGVFSPNCPNPHYLDSSSVNYNCAFSEGFANYHALETAPDAIEWRYDALVDNDFYPLGADGAMWESAVAAALWHIAHSPSLNGAFSANYFAQLMRGGCLVHVPGDWSVPVRPQGIDHMVYCLERESPVSLSLQSLYFGARNPTLSIYWTVSAPSGGPYQSLLRQIWGTYLRGTSTIVVP